MRLVSRVDVNGFATGALQVFCEGAWGAVCTSNFDDRDALVACRQLGFTTGVSEPVSPGFRRVDPDPVRFQILIYYLTISAYTRCFGSWQPSLENSRPLGCSDL